MTTFDDLHQRDDQRRQAPAAALGEPNPDFCDAYGQLLVPYLSPSWRETMLVGALGELELEDQARTIYLLLLRRLPDLTLDEFLDLCGPDEFPAWWRATRPPRPEGQGEEAEGKPTGRASSRRSPWRSQLSAGWMSR